MDPIPRAMLLHTRWIVEARQLIRETLLSRFGNMPDDIESDIRVIYDEITMGELLRLACWCQSPDEFRPVLAAWPDDHRHVGSRLGSRCGLFGMPTSVVPPLPIPPARTCAPMKTASAMSRGSPGGANPTWPG